MSHDSINPLICISPHANTKKNTLVDIIRTDLHFPDHTSRTIHTHSGHVAFVSPEHPLREHARVHAALLRDVHLTQTNAIAQCLHLQTNKAIIHTETLTAQYSEIIGMSTRTNDTETQTYLLGEHSALDVGIVLFKCKGSEHTAD